MVRTTEKLTIRGAPIIIIMQAPQRTQHAPEKNKYATTVERWDQQQLALTRLCHVQTVHELPKIWSDISSLKKEKARN